MGVQGVVSRSRSFQHSRKAEQTRLIGEHEVSCSISIGSAQDHIGYEDPDEVLRNADTAMYHGKAGGKIDGKARQCVRGPACRYMATPRHRNRLMVARVEASPVRSRELRMSTICSLDASQRKTARMRQANLVVYLALLLGALSARAVEPSPVGYWTVFDDDTGNPDAIIEIQTQGGVLIGWIDKIFDPFKDSNPPRCTACEGELKNAPVIGLKIIQDMQPAGDTLRGYIMDPESGKVYNATMSLAEQGQKLEVCGYIGIPLFGRCQTWERVE